MNLIITIVLMTIFVIILAVAFWLQYQFNSFLTQATQHEYCLTEQVGYYGQVFVPADRSIYNYELAKSLLSIGLNVTLSQCYPKTYLLPTPPHFTQSFKIISDIHPHNNLPFLVIFLKTQLHKRLFSAFLVRSLKVNGMIILTRHSS